MLPGQEGWKSYLALNLNGAGFRLGDGHSVGSRRGHRGRARLTQARGGAAAPAAQQRRGSRWPAGLQAAMQ
eukprot:1253501-Pleurochrysis_carterae.AAC.1